MVISFHAAGTAQCCLAASLGIPTCLFCCYLLCYILAPLVEFLSHVYSAPGPGVTQRLDLIDMIVKQIMMEHEKIRPWLASMESEVVCNSIQGRVSTVFFCVPSRCLCGLLLEVPDNGISAPQPFVPLPCCPRSSYCLT